MDLEPGTVTAADGTTLRLWERVPAGADEAVLFVHGSITCSRALFDPPVAGDAYSWLGAAAGRGRAAFALDVRGYGDSDRPPELDEPPEANDPPVRASTAATDIAAAYGAVADRFDVVHLVGVSWGTMTCGYFATHHDHDAASLAQVAPVYRPPWSFAEIAEALNVDPSLDAYYTQEYEAVKERQGDVDELFEAVWTTQVESNQGVDEETYVAQSGALADTKQLAEGGEIYDAAALELPTLALRGSEDAISTRADALSLYDDLATRADYVELSGADHYVMHGERRADCYAAVSDFQDRV